MWHCLRDPRFSRFNPIPACYRQTNTQTDKQIHDDNIYRAIVTSCSKNHYQLLASIMYPIKAYLMHDGISLLESTSMGRTTEKSAPSHVRSERHLIHGSN